MVATPDWPMIEATAGESVADCLTERGGWIRETLRGEGAILLRGFPIASVEDFEAARGEFFREPARYVERATPRRQLGENVFTSTEFPPSETIALHNENSYATSWPGVLLFCCLDAPDEGGATPLADVRRVLGRLSKETVSRFVERGGWMLMRNYTPGFGLGWEQAFGTDRREDVDAYCRRADVLAEWRDGEALLRTRQTRAVLARHPASDEIVWFNHVRFWHAWGLAEEVRELMTDEFGPEGLPYGTFYGDGAEIPDAVVEEIDAAYAAEQTSFAWQPGDLLIVDNMLVAHGREPFSGSRRVVVAMGEPIAREAAAA